MVVLKPVVRYGILTLTSVGCMLLGGAVVHNIFKPNLSIPVISTELTKEHDPTSGPGAGRKDGTGATN